MPVVVGRYFESDDYDDGSSTDDEKEDSDLDGEDDSDKDNSDDYDENGDYDTDDELESEDTTDREPRVIVTYWVDQSEMEDSNWWDVLSPESESIVTSDSGELTLEMDLGQAYFVSLTDIDDAATDASCVMSGDVVDTGKVTIIGYVNPNQNSDLEDNCGVLFRIEDDRNDYGDELTFAFSDGVIDITIIINVGYES